MLRAIIKPSDILSFAILITVFLAPNGYAQLKINAVGDVMPGSVTPKKILPENDKVFINSPGNILNDAGIIFGNLEGTFIRDDFEPEKCSEKSRKRGTCYEFGIPENLAPALKQLGFNVLNQDNNHSEDYGQAGYKFTQEKLSELGIKFVPKRGLAEFISGSKKIAVAAFGYSENSNNINDLQNTRLVISALKDTYDIVIVSFHGGGEGKDFLHVPDSTEIYLGEKRGNVIEFAHTAIDAGADMVIGHGPHVLRAMEIYKNKLIAYSLGNFLTYGNVNISGVNGTTVILQAVLDTTNGNFIRGKIIPVKQIGYGIPEYDDSGSGIKLMRDLTKEDFPFANLMITDSGLIYSITINKIPIRGIENDEINYILPVQKIVE